MKTTIRIAHLADLHIRGLSRHDELRLVFDAFCKDAKANDVDYIFIAGDLWHTKTMGISPEAIDFFTQTFRTLANVAPVHMMLGNHDFNVVNLSRQDTISPIVSAMNDPRVVLYKESGVYEFHDGICWCVFSLYDEHRWASIRPTEGKFNVACFHGSVRGALLDSDWEMSDGIKVDFFSGFDVAMLGDIHRHQFLGERKVNGKNVPWIGYPGSVAQQNFAESLTHGYLLWEIDIAKKTHNVVFRELPNPFPFVTVEWQGNVEKTIKETQAFPDGARFRIRSSSTIMQRDVALLIAELKHKRKATEIAFKIDETVNRDTIQAGTMTVARDDLRNTEVIMEMMREHYELEHISEAEWHKIEALVDSYVKTVQADDAKNTKWSIKKLFWDNTFIYGEGNSIDFEKLRGITGIFAPNRSGKSSIVGTLLYTLFNATDRGSVKNLYVINQRRDFCRASAVVCINGVDYLFERQTAKMENRKGPFGVTSLNLFRFGENGEKIELNGEQRNDTDKLIKSLIGTNDDFLITSVAAQDQLKKYLSEGATHRKQIVSRFLDLDIFERVYDLANKAANSVRTLHKNILVKDWDEINENKQNAILFLRKRIKELEESLPSQRSELFEKREILEGLGQVRPVTSAQIKSKKEDFKIAQNIIEQKKNENASLSQSLEDANRKLKLLTDACEKIDIESLRQKQHDIDDLKNSLRVAEYQLKDEKAKLAQMEKSVKKLQTVPCGDSFPTCPFIRDSHENKVLIETQRVKTESSQNFVNETFEKLRLAEEFGALEKIQKFENAIRAQSKLQSDVTSNTLKIVANERLLSSFQKNAEEIEKQLEEMQKAFDDEQNQLKMRVQADVDELQLALQKNEQEIRDSERQVGVLSNQIESGAQEKETFEKLDSELRIQELVASAFSKRGIPNSVIYGQLPIINEQVNRLLHGIVNFTIELESDVESNALDVFINYGESRRIIELASGMEKVVAALALRAALSIVTTLPKSDIFIIDEGFADLDPTGVEICNRLIVSFKEYFKNVVIITHIDGIKDIADNLIEITRVGIDSKVVYE